jgi:hypothetical protein
MIERVQNFALSVCLKSWDPLTSCSDLLREAEVTSLQSRRDQSSICHLFKIVNGLIDFPNAPIVQREFHYNSIDLQIQQHCQFPPFVLLHTKIPFSRLLFLNGITYLEIKSYLNITLWLHLSITCQSMFLNCYYSVVTDNL